MPLFLFLVSMAFSLGLTLLISIFETIHYVNRKSNWKSYTQQLQGMLQPFLVLGAVGFILTILSLWLNWGGIFSLTPVLLSSVSLGIEGGLVGIEVLLLLTSFKGWEKLNLKHHLLVTWASGIGLGICMWWPIAVAAWMECPLGTVVNLSSMTLEFEHLLWVIFSPLAVCKFFHMLSASWVLGGALLVFVSCKEFVTPSSVVGKWGINVGIIVSFLGLIITMCMGDRTGYNVALQQPMKMAVIQNLQQGGKHASFEVVGPIKISNMLSRLATHSDFGFVPGVEDVVNGGYSLPEGGIALSLKSKNELAIKFLKNYDKTDKNPKILSYQSQYLGYRNLLSPDSIQPSHTINYWSFRIMIASGLLLLLVLIFISYGIIKKNIPPSTLIRSSKRMLPLAICSSLCGWIISMLGKSPWAISDFLTETDALSSQSIPILLGQLVVLCLITFTLVLWIFRKLKVQV